ncbi:MAG: YaaL family protein [Defluviitaleaceae bacterium]|nr:YaaL family protein [Defluviitaleaceae bacterium]
MNLAARVTLPRETSKPKRKFFGKQETISKEDMEIIYGIEDAKEAIEETRQKLNYTTDPMLIDSYAYELKAITMKYQYYLKLCKEKGIIIGV